MTGPTINSFAWQRTMPRILPANTMALYQMMKGCRALGIRPAPVAYGFH